MTNEEFHIISNTSKDTNSSNKWLSILVVFILVIVLVGLGIYIFFQNKRNLDQGKTGTDDTKDTLTLLPYFAPKENYPEGYVKEPESIVEDKKDEFFVESGKIVDAPNMISVFTVNYTIKGTISSISSEFLSDNTQEYWLTINNDLGQYIRLSFSEGEIKESKFFVDASGNIREIGFFDLKKGDEVGISAILDITDTSPNVYTIVVYEK